jgi:glycosyltransferase involved in cell wall biosynthesis
VEISRSVKSIFKYVPYLLANAIRLRGIIKKEKIEVVQANDFYNLLGVVLKMIGTKAKLITYIRFLPSAMPESLRNIWIRLAHKYADRVIAVSQAVINELPLHPSNTLIYDPVKFTERYPPKRNEDNGTVRILYMANYINGKGQQYALEAFANAYAKNNTLRLKFTGGDMGLEKNKQFKRDLQQTAAQLGVKDVVAFEAFSPVAEHEVKSADIALNFSLSESFSMTCLEAAFYGTSLIATRCGGPEEIIQDKVSGLLVPIKDVAAMTEAILILANDRELRNQYASAGQQYVRSRFAVEKFVAEFEDVLKNISNN